ncbi:MAG TPA: DUF2341 domain-containing protein [Candidatus Krumholzibacteria bacterium]|nr:DUF2341 domain-containing protein [Candidatus Krumholzibacteria bacterium]HPD73041.1 DUF2341 domain-containing protein [Candidatus Krumholzibacteria bacterium]HRY41840.1 DUF2341 domain-containing protein [Candidatus Krumholzibacteria bacterium]
MNRAQILTRRAWAIVSVCLALLVGPGMAQDIGDWAYQRPVSVTNDGSTLTDYQVKIVLDGDNFDFAQAAADGADLLFTDIDGYVFYPYWIETWNPAAEHAVVWVRVPELPGGATTIFALLCGNPAATARSDGAGTFLFFSSFEELAGAGGMNAPAPLVTPTYDGSGQVVHPDVLHVPGGWNGYEYWMGMTPYPNGNDDYENPSILVSHDNSTWVVPPGLTNPLVPMPPGHNDDTEILLVDGQMILYFNETNNNGTTYVKRMTSSDGVTWNGPQTVITLPNYVMSPTVIYDEGIYKMWYVRSTAGCSATSQAFSLRTSVDGIAWDAEQVATLDHAGRVLWHMDVQRNAGLYTMLFISYPNGSNCGVTQLYYAESADGLAWTANPNPVLKPVASRWDSANIYRASYIIDGTWLRIWYSAMSTSGQWRVGYTEGDLEEFVTPAPVTWTQITGNATATTDHPRTGTHGLREIGASTYPRVFAPLTNGDICINVWYWEGMSTTTNFMALLRLWDSDNSVYLNHCIGTGIWVGTSTAYYIYHNEGFIYHPTTVPRSAGWRHLSIASSPAGCEFRIDGTPVATTTNLDPALINRFSVEGYLGGTGYFDDAYVRRYAVPEPAALVGEVGVVQIEDLPGDEPAGQTPAAVVILEQNIPNPLNPGTTIAFSLPRPEFVTLQIVDLRGRVIRTLVAGPRESGRHEVIWDGRDAGGSPAASGTYLYRLVTPERVIGKKLMLVK